MIEIKKRKVEMELHYQNYIEAPPITPTQMYSQACSSDGVTVDTWRKTWLDQTRANKARFGSFKNKSIGKLFGTQRYKPVIVAGSGPSLKYNADELKNRGDITLVSCLHNYHFFEDRGIKPEYYVSLDAGPITITEVSEGGSKKPDEYWESTKDKTLLAFVGSNPELLEKWKGEILFFTCPVPDASYMQEAGQIENFHTYVSTGGNVLGASFYIAKAILGANPIAFIGADFSFSYDKKFHGWDSQYDKNLGQVLGAMDVFGNKVLTWQSYYNFKSWFDSTACRVSGIYINCTEGGCFGAYPEGNLMAVRQMPLREFIWMYHMSEEMRTQCENPETEERKLLF